MCIFIDGLSNLLHLSFFYRSDSYHVHLQCVLITTEIVSFVTTEWSAKETKINKINGAMDTTQVTDSNFAFIRVSATIFFFFRHLLRCFALFKVDFNRKYIVDMVQFKKACGLRSFPTRAFKSPPLRSLIES